MVQLNQKLLDDSSFWKNKNVDLPKYDRKKTPIRSIAFAAGRMAFGHTGDILQDLLNVNPSVGQMLGVKSNSLQSAEEFTKSDSLITQFIFENEKGKVTPRIIGAIKDTIYCDGNKNSPTWQTLLKYARDPQVQFATINAPEIVYGVTFDHKKEFATIVDPKLKLDIENGTIETDPAKWVFFAQERFKAGLKFAFVSCTNFSANGNFTAACMKTIAKGWEDKGFAPKGFYAYLSNPDQVGFPNCMIDRIAVAPDDATKTRLADLGYQSPLVVTEKARYWVVEDKFPAGRPPFEKAKGVILENDYLEVKKYEDMKLRVLNMSHSTIAHLGVLLGYKGNYGIYKAINDKNIRTLINNIISIVKRTIPSPNQMNVEAFAQDTIERLMNANIPDDPMRIASSGSAKMHPRFLETFFEATEKKLPKEELNQLLLPVAGFIRYTLGVDDQGNAFNLEKDQFLDLLTKAGKSTTLGNAVITPEIKAIISHKGITGKDLYQFGDAGKTLEEMVVSMLKGKNAVKETIEKYLQ